MRWYGEEEEEQGEEKESWTRGGMRSQETLLFVRSELPCFSLVLNFDKLRLLLGSVSLLSRGHGRRDIKPCLGIGGRGKGAQRVERGGWPGGDGQS